jgi:hypothetical protein
MANGQLRMSNDVEREIAVLRRGQDEDLGARETLCADFPLFPQALCPSSPAGHSSEDPIEPSWVPSFSPPLMPKSRVRIG